jgi:hypothetical protein
MEQRFWQGFLIPTLARLSTRLYLRLLHGILYVTYRAGVEVLTGMLQLPTVLNLAVPRIYAYSLDPLNPVGAEYILEEKAGGKPLGTLWHQWQTESHFGLVTQLVDFETKLASVLFRRHGCIYYKNDLEKKGGRVYNLEAGSLSSTSPTGRLNSVLTEDFVLGPLTKASLWERERATMNLDQGPCKLFMPF